MPPLYSSAEFARAHGLSEQRVRQLLAASRIEGARRVGARWVIPQDAAIRRTLAVRPPRRRVAILRRAARACGVRVDVIFADTLPPAVKRAMLKDARRASLV